MKFYFTGGLWRLIGAVGLHFRMRLMLPFGNTFRLRSIGAGCQVWGWAVGTVLLVSSHTPPVEWYVNARPPDQSSMWLTGGWAWAWRC